MYGVIPTGVLRNDHGYQMSTNIKPDQASKVTVFNSRFDLIPAYNIPVHLRDKHSRL